MRASSQDPFALKSCPYVLLASRTDQFWIQFYLSPSQRCYAIIKPIKIFCQLQTAFCVFFVTFCALTFSVEVHMELFQLVYCTISLQVLYAPYPSYGYVCVDKQAAVCVW